ncbi:hypothetical protein [Thiocystis violascens]|uniref:Uncharacterized protein n=1 Tax=Thiocystis violascens (strain ATCC 17096 / DSM 198 / 6111) TaxID=765911 RepID=I3YDC7_THIV6|nr:hypothetical protein [Thiocystis violascens]AFL74995.1 hypothetical protein Thivi_3118 [Thiocystis violascens DSM 198]
MSSLRAIIEELITTLPQAHPVGGSGVSLDFPSFDLFPQDYLKFAESSLGKESPEDKINCVSNLKRVMECAMDIFLHTLGLASLAKKRSLSFDKKLDFVSKIEIYKSRSLEKLNNIRNKVEHEYVIPDLPEIELYFELVYAFISVLDAAMFMYAADSEINYSADQEKSFSCDLSVEYSHEAQRVYFFFSAPKHKDLTQKEYSFGVDNIEEFTNALAVYFWVVRGNTLFSDKYVEEKLHNINSTLLL